MITQGDDYPLHQTPEPVQQVFTSDRNFYDRFFFNGYFREGEPYFAAAMGIYPNVGIIDGAFSVVADGVQHCVRASRVLGADRLDTRVGPVSIEVVRPMRALRVRVDHEAVKADLVFEARAMPIEEPRFTRRTGPRLTFDLTRFTQHGGYTGSLTVGARTYDANPSRVWGSRDRSWGVRNIGPQDPAGVPAATMPQFFWLWSPSNFEDFCTHFDVNENEDGSRWHQFGAVTRAEPSALRIACDSGSGERITSPPRTLNSQADEAGAVISAASAPWADRLAPTRSRLLTESSPENSVGCGVTAACGCAGRAPAQAASNGLFATGFRTAPALDMADFNRSSAS